MAHGTAYTIRLGRRFDANPPHAGLLFSQPVPIAVCTCRHVGDSHFFLTVRLFERVSLQLDSAGCYEVCAIPPRAVEVCVNIQRDTAKSTVKRFTPSIR